MDVRPDLCLSLTLTLADLCMYVHACVYMITVIDQSEPGGDLDRPRWRDGPGLCGVSAHQQIPNVHTVNAVHLANGYHSVGGLGL